MLVRLLIKSYLFNWAFFNTCVAAGARMSSLVRRLKLLRVAAVLAFAAGAAALAVLLATRRVAGFTPGLGALVAVFILTAFASVALALDVVGSRRASRLVSYEPRPRPPLLSFSPLGRIKRARGIALLAASRPARSGSAWQRSDMPPAQPASPVHAV